MKKFIPWVAALGIITVVFGTIYVVGQQSLRLGANDPQLQMAEDAAANLNSGMQTPAEIATKNVDMGKSLAPFVIIYNKEGRAIAGSGYLDGSLATIPYGVLQHTKPGQAHWITWQPSPGVRIASVTVASSNYYVLAGRNLREVEKDVTLLMWLSGIGWLATVAILAGAFMLSPKAKP